MAAVAYGIDDGRVHTLDSTGEEEVEGGSAKDGTLFKIAVSPALTAPATAGTCNCTLTCGGQETGIAALTVTAPVNVIKFPSTTHN